MPASTRIGITAGLFCSLLAMTAETRAAEAPAKAEKAAAKGEAGEGKPAKALRFITFGDWGRNGFYNQAEVAKQMARTAEDSDAAFITALGDNFYTNGVRSVQDPIWNASFENIYTHPSLFVDWYVALGNHDYRGNPQAEVDYTKISRRWNMPARYYSVHKSMKGEGGGVDLFFIDTSPFQRKYYSEDTYAAQVAGQDTAAQRRWLDSALAASHAAWKLVFGHHPVYSSGEHGKELGEMPAQFGALFEKRGVNAYFAGHDHDFEHLENRGVQYFIVGTGSEVRPLEKTRDPHSKMNLASPGFGLVSLTDKELRLTFIDKDGKNLYAVAIPKRKP